MEFDFVAMRQTPICLGGGIDIIFWHLFVQMFPMPLRNLFLCVRGQRLLGTPHTARCQPPHRVLPVKSPLALVRALDLEGRHGCPLLALRRPSVVSRSRWKNTNVKCRLLCLKSHTSFNVASSNTRMSSKRYLWPTPLHSTSSARSSSHSPRSSSSSM